MEKNEIKTAIIEELQNRNIPSKIIESLKSAKSLEDIEQDDFEIEYEVEEALKEVIINDIDHLNFNEDELQICVDLGPSTALKKNFENAFKWIKVNEHFVIFKDSPGKLPEIEGYTTSTFIPIDFIDSQVSDNDKVEYADEARERYEVWLEDAQTQEEKDEYKEKIKYLKEMGEMDIIIDEGGDIENLGEFPTQFSYDGHSYEIAANLEILTN